MKIDLKCRCGAAATFHDGEFINGGGRKDEKGRVFVVEQRAEEWMERHQPCLTTEQAALRDLVAALREYGSFPPRVLPALQAAEPALGVKGEGNG